MNHPRVFSEEWFTRHQSKLLKFANSRLGRKVLQIEKGTKITRIGTNFYQSEGSSPNQIVSTVFINERNGQLLYKKLKPIWKLAHFWDMTFANRLHETLNLGFDTTNVYPDAHPEVTTVDGYVARSAVSDDFSTIRTSFGTQKSDASRAIFGTIISANATTDRYDFMSRYVGLFDTSFLETTDTVTAATLRIYAYNRLSGLGDTTIDVVTSNPASNTSLSTNDYSSVLFGTTVLNSNTVNVSDVPISGTGSLDFTLNATGISNITKGGITKLGLRTGFDTSNSAPTWSSNGSTGFYMLAAEDLSFAPRLQITHTITIEESIDAPLSLTGTLTASADHFTSITADIAFDISIFTNLQDAQQIEKAYQYKVYDNGSFVGLWTDVANDLQYTQEINSAGSSIRVELARSAERLVEVREAFNTESTAEDLTTEAGEVLNVVATTTKTVGSGTDVDLNFDVEIWVFYGSNELFTTEDGEVLTDEDNEELLAAIGAANGRRIFQGYIYNYIVQYGAQERVLVDLMSHGAELSNDVVTDGSNTTVTYSSQDPGAIIRDLLDKYAGTVTYDTTTVELTSTSVSYTYRLNTYLDAIKIANKLAPDDWYWFNDMGENKINFHLKGSTADHLFILGKHIQSFSLSRSIEELVNTVYFVGGDTGSGILYKKFTDATSISNYREGLEILQDQRVTTSATATTLSNRLIDAQKDPVYTSTIAISDTAFDIESIQVGDMVSFGNFNNFVDDLLLQVVSLSYTPQIVTLQLELLLDNTNKRIEDINRNQRDIAAESIPNAPT